MYGIFAPNFPPSGLFSHSTILRMLLPLRFPLGFNFNFNCSMRRRAPVCKIERLSDQVEDVSVAHPVRLWYLGHNWFLWVHTSAVINNLPIYGNINTTIQTVNGEVVLVTVSRSIHLLDVDDDWLNIKVCPI